MKPKENAVLPTNPYSEELHASLVRNAYKIKTGSKTQQVILYPNKKNRYCLKCGVSFISKDYHNRLCSECHIGNSQYSVNSQKIAKLPEHVNYKDK